jgi:hypothetical protein
MRRSFLFHELHAAFGAVAGLIAQDIGMFLHRAGVLMGLTVVVVLFRLAASGHGERGDSKRQRQHGGEYPFHFHFAVVPFVFGVVIEP